MVFPLVLKKPIDKTELSGLRGLMKAYPNAFMVETDEEYRLVDLTVDVDALKIKALNDLKIKCGNLMDQVVGDYSEREITTFDQQLTEAKAYLEDGTYEPVLLSEIAKARNIPLDELCSRVIKKSDAYTLKAGQLLGLRQQQEDRIDACSTIEELQEVIETSVL